MKKKKRIAIIDSDILVFRTAAACEERSIDVLHKSSGKSKTFSNRTTFKAFLSEKNYEYKPDDYMIEDVQTLNDNMSYQFLIDSQLKSIQERLWADETLLYVAGSNNFRDTLPFPKKYKGQREDVMKPLLRNECKSYLIGKHKAEVCNGEEVDDRIIWKGLELLNQGHEVILVTIDKDARAYAGLKLYDYTQDSPEIVDIPSLGSLWLNEKGDVKGLGCLWYAVQHLIADKTDGMSTKDLTGITFGEKSAYKLLKDCKSEHEVLGLVISKYREWIGDSLKEYTDYLGNKREINWLGAADLYFKGIRMKENKEYLPNFKLFASKYGHTFDDECINRVIEAAA